LSLSSTIPKKTKYVIYKIEKNPGEEVSIWFNADKIKNMTKLDIINFLNNENALLKDLNASPSDRTLQFVDVSTHGNYKSLRGMDAVDKILEFLKIEEGDIKDITTMVKTDIEGVKFSSSGKGRKNRIPKY
jgi:hypothetical protein